MKVEMDRIWRSDEDGDGDMDKKIIAVDCDDVLINTTPYFVETYNRLYGTSTTLDQLDNQSHEIWGSDEATVSERWANLATLDGYKSLKPNPNDADVLRQLSQHYKLHLVTARGEDERDFTVKMLDSEFTGIFSDLHFVGWGNSKGEVCRRIGAEALVDDNATHIEDAVRHGLSRRAAILFGIYPWNQAYRTAHQNEVVNCANWLEVKNYIDTTTFNQEVPY